MVKKDYINKSLIEIAIEVMENDTSFKPRTLDSITAEVFQLKGLDYKNEKELVGQFQIDFMLCGLFVCCGETKKNEKLWDLKSRQKHDVIDKDAYLIDDPYEDDEDVLNNELKDETYDESEDGFENSDADKDDEDEEEEEKDDIEEEFELMSNEYYEDDELDEDKFDDVDE